MRTGIPSRRVVSRHLLRRRARAHLHDLHRVQQEGTPATQTLAGVHRADRLKVERAGRIRARWVVVAETLPR